MRITDLPALSAADLTENDAVAVDHNTGNGIETRKLTWKNLLNKLYPVGCIYQSASSTSPASFLGGTWAQIKDTFILAAGDTYEAGSTGGEAKHTLTLSEMPAHTHRLWIEGKTYEAQGMTLVTSISANQHTVDVSQNLWMDSKGGSESHNNMPPYLTAYIWERIA